MMGGWCDLNASTITKIKLFPSDDGWMGPFVSIMIISLKYDFVGANCSFLLFVFVFANTLFV